MIHQPLSGTGPIIKYIPLQQGLRQFLFHNYISFFIIKYIPLQQGLRLYTI